MDQAVIAANPKPLRTIPVYASGLRPGENVNSNDAVNRQVREGMKWRFGGVDDWTDEKIFATLHDLGIAADPEQFRAEAIRCRSVDALAETWRAGFDDDDLWVDFPYFAARALWHRLAPDIATPESAADAIDDCDKILLETPRDHALLVSKITAFLDFMEDVPAESMPERLRAVQRHTLTMVGPVCEDVMTELGPDHIELARRIFDVYTRNAGGTGTPVSGAFAQVLARAGHLEEAKKHLADQMAAAPDDAGTYLSAFIVAAQARETDAMVEYAVKTLQLEKRPDTWDYCNDTIKMKLADCNELARYSDIAKRTAKPHAWTAPLLGSATRSAIPAPPQSRSAVGRNDPCPCGSGLKYKKCCGR